ncbi:CASP-like protein 2C1 [Amaranthus tricolor]|uniref:CASP-like protein 2C1 n=1 Tax=Amaranthus tricolor TaxID=29722 RepID=UPI002587ABB9|nr:CASP-like protein 2C1 [Amaranthus tricolor]
MEITIKNLIKVEAYLRSFAFLTLSLAAIVMATDRQTKIYFGAYKKTVDFRVATIFKASMYVYATGAGYSLFQLVRCLAFTATNSKVDKLSLSNHILKWIYFLLDQIAVYVAFAIVCASIEIGFLALTGNNELEWMKLCSKFVRFCFHFGGSVACAFVSSVLLALISAISSFSLFTWYSPNFLCLKPKKIGIASTNIN